MADLTVELFPTEQDYRGSWYEPDKKAEKQSKKKHSEKFAGSHPNIALNESNKTTSSIYNKRFSAQGTRGALYCCYKKWRKIFRDSKLSTANNDSDDSDCESSEGNLSLHIQCPNFLVEYFKIIWVHSNKNSTRDSFSFSQTKFYPRY